MQKRHATPRFGIAAFDIESFAYEARGRYARQESFLRTAVLGAS